MNDLDVLTGALFLFAYLIGSIPFGVLVARLFHVKDLTQKGSGNIGATNVSRVVGFWPAGFLTFLLDVGKGGICVFLATPVGFRLLSGVFFGGNSPFHDVQLSTLSIWAAGFFAVFGHCFSPWLNFRGGKGVATGLGVVLVLSPISAICGVIAFAMTFVSKRIASLASISGLILAAVVYLILNPVGAHLCVGAAMLLMILIRHEGNIDALLENREKPLKP